MYAYRCVHVKIHANISSVLYIVVTVTVVPRRILLIVASVIFVQISKKLF